MPQRAKLSSTLGLAIAGGALEFYNFVIFVFLTDIIGLLFFPPDLPAWLTRVQTFGVFAAGYIFRPLGGIVIAHFGDTFGRKRVFAFSILLMAVSTLAMAFIPTYKSIGVAAPIILLILRIMQGIAIGGEIPGAWTFVSEHAPPSQVGFACSLVCAGLGVGILLGSTIVTLVSGMLGASNMLEYGWRIPFLIGGILGLLAVQLRRILRETPSFLELRKNNMLALELPLSIVLKTHSRGIFLSMLGTWILSAIVVILMLMQPMLLQETHRFTRAEALIGTSVGTLSLISATILAGKLVDRIGLGRFFCLGGCLLLASAFLSYCTAAQTASASMYLCIILTGVSGSALAGVPIIMVRSFPPHVRFSGVAFSYNISYALFGGITPVAIAALMPYNPIAYVYYLFLIGSITVALGIYLMFFSVLE